MESWMAVILFSIIGGEIRYLKKKKWEESHILPKSGTFRLAPDCKHPQEYLCIKCGDCGRKFIK